jgi:hypothetical protein
MISLLSTWGKYGTGKEVERTNGSTKKEDKEHL